METKLLATLLADVVENLLFTSTPPAAAATVTVVSSYPSPSRGNS
jgi:hypothetical protein